MERPIAALLVTRDSARALRIQSVLTDHVGPQVEVSIADGLDPAFERLDAGGIDIALLDVALADDEEPATFDAMRRRAPSLPIVVLVGAGDEAVGLQRLRDGAQDYLVLEEFDGRSAMRAVRAAIERARRLTDPGRSSDVVRKLILAVDQSPAAVIITDTSGTIEYVNRRFTENTGYAPAEALGNNPRMLKSGLTPPEVYHDLWQTIRRGDVWRGEIRNRNKDGALAWHAATITPVRDPFGRVTHFLATQEDITERKLVESQLRDRNQLFHLLAENIPEVFFAVAADYSETLYISPAYETIWGQTCQSLYDNPRAFLDAVVSEDRDALLAVISGNQRDDAGGELDFRVRRPDGTVRWVLARSIGIRNDRGEIYRICGVVVDITERHRMEEALREGEALYRKLTEASFDAISRIEDGIIREANQGFIQIFGYDAAAEVVGRPVTDFVAEESQGDVVHRVSLGIEGRYEFAGKRKDGARIQVEATGRSLDVGGRRGRLTALRDITEKRALGEQFRQAQKMEAVGRLAGGVAHDFNNLLMVIIGYCEMLLEDLGPSDPRRSHADEILGASRKAAGLTRQLLAFSRQQIVQPRLVSVEEVVRDSEKMLRRLISEDVDLRIVLSPTPATVRIDPSQLEQAIMNLVINARDAMPGGGRLIVETATIELGSEYARTHWPASPGRYAMLAVTDTGVGMDEATRAKVFEPFFTTKESGKGTGLGLSMVYGIVKQNGGFIWVYSEPAKGATFKIYLPLVNEAPAASAAPDPVAEIRQGTETLLLAEDDPAVRGVVLEALERFGYRVLVAEDAQQALKLLGAHPGHVDLLITDVVMPGMSGRQLAAEFLARRPGARVLYMSGYTPDAIVRHGLLDPGIAYLQKPFSPEALARKLREVLDQP